MENKCKIFKKGNKQSGITLVALVVTIVVLLILAGIGIRLVLDNNGIINKAGEGKEKYGQAKENEQTDLDNALDWIDEMTGANIVEPENVDDWEYKTEDDGTLTITGYKGTATEVVIPNSIDGVRVKKLYGATTSYASSQGIKMSIWDDSIWSGEKVYLGSEWIKGQNTIKKIIISKGIEEIGDWAFAGTLGVESIDIPNSVTSIGFYAFKECLSLENVTIPDSVVNIGARAFHSCKSLTAIAIPDSVTSIKERTFTLCESLTNIIIPNSITDIENYAFSACSSLTKISIPDSVTSIGNYAFEECEGLTSITIPNTVTSIGASAFVRCSALTTVNYTGTEEQWKNITIGTNNNSLTSATIVYNYKE